METGPSEEEVMLLCKADDFENQGELDEAEELYRKAVFIYPYSELCSLKLFHFLWDLNRTDDAFEEMKRFQSISHSDDYTSFVREINGNAAS